MSVWLVAPVKPLDESKSRLAACLAQTERAALTRTLLERTLLLARASRCFEALLVVSRDDAVLNVAAAAGALTLHEAGSDLNLALEQGCAQAWQQGADAALILPTDLPLLTAADIATLVARHTAHGIVLSPSQDGGTNALLLPLPAPLPFCFGVDSFARHRQAALAADLDVAVYTSPTLAFDLDRPEDLALLRAGATPGG